MTPKIKWVSVTALLCVHLLLVSCGNWGQGSRPHRPPHAPAEVKAEIVDQGVQVSWSAVPGVHKYTVFWGFTSGEYRGMVNTRDSALILAGISKGEMLYLAVTAWNEAGESPYSSEQALVNDDDPRRAGQYVTKGQEALHRQDYLEAAAYLYAAIRLDPRNADAYRYRAMLYERINQSDLARKDHQWAEKIFKKKLLSKKPTTD